MLNASACQAIDDFNAHGCAVIDPLIDPQTCDTLLSLLDPLLTDDTRPRPGARRVLIRVPQAVDLINQSPIAELITTLGGPTARVVRSLLFDKTPETNWLVPWHQDPTIAVAERLDVPGFGPWNTKDGETHCRPPIDVLESIFIVRVHLDPCSESSGPLRIVPDSHRRGVFTEEQIQSLTNAANVLTCTTGKGGAVLMRPLSLHASAKSSAPSSRRRVLHLECSAADLPLGLRWGEAVTNTN